MLWRTSNNRANLNERLISTVACPLNLRTWPSFHCVFESPIRSRCDCVSRTNKQETNSTATVWEKLPLSLLQCTTTHNVPLCLGYLSTWKSACEGLQNWCGTCQQMSNCCRFRRCLNLIVKRPQQWLWEELPSVAWACGPRDRNNNFIFGHDSKLLYTYTVRPGGGEKTLQSSRLPPPPKHVLSNTLSQWFPTFLMRSSLCSFWTFSLLPCGTLTMNR